MNNKRWRTVLGSALGLTIALASSCVSKHELTDSGAGGSQGGTGVGGSGDDNKPVTWKPGDDQGHCNVDALLQPQSYGNKVKALITGLPLDDAELGAIQQDAGELPGLIDQWVGTPEAEGVLQRLFMTAFQQTGGNNESLFYFFGYPNSPVGFFKPSGALKRSPRLDEMLNQNFAESMARTAIEFMKQGKPFSEVISTDRFMMTTAMKSFLAFTDDEQIDDDESHNVRTTTDHFPKITLKLNQAEVPPPVQVTDPNDPGFATFWHPKIDSPTLPQNCPPDYDKITEITIDTTQSVNGDWIISGGRSPSFYVFSALVLGRVQPVRRKGGAFCGINGSNQDPLVERTDFEDWHWVTVRKPAAGEEPTLFYDLDRLRDPGQDLVVHTPRAGFLTHPGFFSTWPTNDDNSSRVTINQALIVALGSTFDGVLADNFDPGAKVDTEHAEPNSECYGCHQTLDPMRDLYRASFTNFYGEQLDPERAALSGDFVFGGVHETEKNGIEDLVQILAAHPMFPQAWAQKLCYYANAQACPESEELDRVVKAFVDSSLDFRVLLRELFSSPLVTGSACLPGVNGGITATIARRSTFCHQLSNRLGVGDLCGLLTASADADKLQNDVRAAVASVPDDGFSRSSAVPVVIAETGLFTRANREAACDIIAGDGYQQIFGSKTADEALLAMVEDLMGLPLSDARHDAALAILKKHVDEVVATGESETVGLQSAMALACMAPSSAGVGF